MADRMSRRPPHAPSPRQLDLLRALVALGCRARRHDLARACGMGDGMIRYSLYRLEARGCLTWQQAAYRNAPSLVTITERGRLLARKGANNV